MTTKVDATHGHVYIVSRVDLNKCYIGQSIREGRRFEHLKPGSYQYEELCADGIAPHIYKLEEDIERGAVLDESEREWMQVFEEEGWTVINRMNHTKLWFTLSDYASLGGKLGGPIGGARTQAHRREDPEFNAYWLEVAAKAGGKALYAKLAADPAAYQDHLQNRLDALSRGVETSKWKSVNDPEWRKRRQEIGRQRGLKYGKAGGRAVSRIQRQCEECGHGPTTPGGLGFHQKSTAHQGIIELGTLPESKD